MSGSLIIRNRQRTIPVNARFLRRLASGLLRDWLKQEEFELAIYLVGTREMTELNEKFLRHQGSTDVITFDYADKVGQASSLSRSGGRSSSDRLEACPTLRGEIFICLDEAVAQARRFRSTWQSELARYVIHGMLHLIGHDDSKSTARRRMKREENRLLLGIARGFPLRQLSGGSKVGA